MKYYLYNPLANNGILPGVSLEELNSLERAFLSDLGYNLFLTPEMTWTNPCWMA